MSSMKCDEGSKNLKCFCCDKVILRECVLCIMYKLIVYNDLIFLGEDLGDVRISWSKLSWILIWLKWIVYFVFWF